MAFDYRFDLDEDYWEGPGTRSANDWLRDLRKYQDVCGFGEVPPKTHEPFGPLAQWVQRMRRYADSGILPFEIAAELATMGVPLEIDRNKQSRTLAQEGSAFERNLALLKDWMRAAGTPIVDLTYLGSRHDDLARRCYTFLEHQRLKLKQGVLKEEHQVALCALALRINGTSIADWILPKKSLRDIKKMVEQNEALRRLPWAEMSEADVAAWCNRATREKWRLGMYVPSRGVTPAEIRWIPGSLAHSVPGDPFRTLMIFNPRTAEKGLVFRMRPPGERLAIPPAGLG